MHLTKHHGLGNDFLVLLDECQPAAVAVDGALARAVCDRHRGVGADGLLHGRAPGASDGDVDVVMRLHNADGGIAEMSGNGIRCFAQAVARARHLDDGATLRIGTDAGVRVVQLGRTAGAEVEVEVDMGVPGDGPVVPAAVADRLAGHALETADFGNPHLVVRVDDATVVDPGDAGPWLEAQFPDGVNIEFISLAVAEANPVIDLRVWERGVGVTEACGTGACAATVAAARWGLIGDRARVAMAGGSATVLLRADGGVTLIGPSVHVASVQWEGV
ncbi:MAG: diaminopimelate epimerase [Acidimicrobiales bacterium]